MAKKTPPKVTIEISHELEVEEFKDLIYNALGLSNLDSEAADKVRLEIAQSLLEDVPHESITASTFDFDVFIGKVAAEEMPTRRHGKAKSAIVLLAEKAADAAGGKFVSDELETPAKPAK